VWPIPSTAAHLSNLTPLHDVTGLPDDAESALDRLVLAEARARAKDAVARVLVEAPPRLRAFLLAVLRHDGNVRAAENELGLSRGTGRQYRRRLREVCAANGVGPEP
jgi:hypothetical protein